MICDEDIIGFPAFAPPSQPFPTKITCLLDPKVDIVGQPRTGKSKKFVVYKPSNPSSVYKGPYTVNENRFTNIISRSRILENLNTEHIMISTNTIQIPQVVCGEKNSSTTLAFVFPNILGKMPDPYKVNRESWPPEYTYTIRSQEGDGMMKLAEYLKSTNDTSVLTYGLLRDYVLLFILGVGDMGLHNTLIHVPTRKVYIIDYEDNLGKVRDDPTFYFNKPSPEKYGVYKTLGKYYNRLADELSDTKLQFHEEKLSNAIRLLRKYATEPTEEEEKEEDEHSDVDEALSNPSPDGDIVPIAPVSGGGPIIGKGKIVYTNMRVSSKTIHGYSSSLIKSAIQKSIRRGMIANSIASAFELWQFFRTPEAKPLIHNMYNRLLVIACEDVSPRTLEVQSYVCGWVVHWVRETKNPYSSPSGFEHDTSMILDEKGVDVSVEKQYSPTRLAGIVHLLADHQKSRIASHIYKAYTRVDGIAMLKKKKYVVEDPLKITPTDRAFMMKKPHPFLRDSDYKIDGGSFAIALCAIYNRLNDKDPNVVRWVESFMKTHADQPLKEAVNKRRKGEAMLWVVFAQFVSPGILTNIRDGYFYISEQRPLYMCVVCNILYGTQPETYNPLAYDKYAKAYRSPGAITPYVTADYQLEITDYMADKHTGKRGDEEELHKQFVLEGAQVNNQDPLVFNSVYKEIYETLSFKEQK